MRKLRVALVLLLLLAFFAVSQTSFAMTTLGIADSMGVGKSKATLDDIQKKLASGSSDIAMQSQLLDANAKYMAKQNLAKATAGIAAGQKTKASIKPPSTAGMSVPTQGIGDAIKALGSIHIGLTSPASMLKSMAMPRLAVMS